MPELLTDGADEFGVLGGTLDEDVPRPVQRCRGVGNAVAQELRGHLLRHERRVGEQSVGQWLQTCLAGDLRLGPPLGFVRQIDVLDPGLGVRRHQRGPQLVGELALLLDGGQDRRATVVELAQIPEALLEGPQLAVIEAAGDLLAVPGDERNGRALVEQPNGGRDLSLPDTEFLSNTGIYGLDGCARSHPQDPTEYR